MESPVLTDFVSYPEEDYLERLPESLQSFFECNSTISADKFSLPSQVQNFQWKILTKIYLLLIKVYLLKIRVSIREPDLKKIMIISKLLWKLFFRGQIDYYSFCRIVFQPQITKHYEVWYVSSTVILRYLTQAESF